MAPDYLANTTALLIERGQMPDLGPFMRQLLVFGIDPGHLSMEALVELGSNLTDVSTGWLLPSLALDRLALAQVMPATPARRLR